MLLAITFYMYGVSAHYKPKKDTNKPSPPILHKASNCSHSSSRVSDIFYKTCCMDWDKKRENNKPNTIPTAPFSLCVTAPLPGPALPLLFPSLPFSSPVDLVSWRGLFTRLCVTSKQLVTALITDAFFFFYSNMFFQLEENTLLSRLALSRRYSRYDIVPMW